MNEQDIKQSVDELKEALITRYGDEIELYLFGSTARKDYGSESDIDVLVLLPGEVDTRVEEDIFDIAYDFELKNDVVFGIVVHSKEFWGSDKASVMPFHQNVLRDALRI